MSDVPPGPDQPARPGPPRQTGATSGSEQAPRGAVPSPATALIALDPPPGEVITPAEDVPIGRTPDAVAAWFDTVADAEAPENDGTLAAARLSARAWSRRAKADNTRAAYRWAVRAWCAWCDQHGLSPLPASGPDVAAFLAAERDRGLTPNTLDLRRAAIRYLHHTAGCPSPTDDALVGETLAGIRRAAPNPGKKRAATLAVLREFLAPIADDLPGRRDRALILVGFAGALRRSELAAIHLADLVRTDQGFELALPRSKGAQTTAVTVPLPYGRTALCPVRALTAWLEAAGITDGPVFRRLWLPPASPDGPPPLPRLGTAPLTPRSIARIVQARAAAAGFGRLEFGGHSLKRGALTTGMNQKAHAAQLKRLGRHKTFDVLGEYLEFGDLFEAHPLRDVL
jgi:integrase